MLVSQKRSQTAEEEFSDEEINYMMQHMMPKVFSLAMLYRSRFQTQWLENVQIFLFANVVWLFASTFHPQ